MRNTFVRVAFGVLGVVALHSAGCRQEQQAGDKDFVEFRDFLDATKKATFRDFANKPGVRVTDEAAFEDMKRHLLDLYSGITPEHSFLVGEHDVVDCVAVEQQPGARSAAMAGRTIQMNAMQRIEPKASVARKNIEAKPVAKDMDITLHSGSKDRLGHAAFCTTRYVPMKRLALADITRFRTLGDFFAKRPLSSHESDRSDEHNPIPGLGHHGEVYGHRDGTNFGGDTWLNVWNPVVPTDNDLSLGQLWVVGGSDAGLQTAESGWQVYPHKYGRKEASLFIYYTTANYDHTKPGCYNMECKAFVQVNNTICIGCGFDHYSTTDGTQWGFTLHWQMSGEGDWWLFYKGPGDYIAVGYYPKGTYGNGQLSRNGDNVAFGGEVSGDPIQLQMGSGAFPSAGWQKAAFQKRIFYIDTLTSAQWVSLTKFETDPDCYKVDITNLSGGDWETYHFGGPKCPVN